MVGHIKDNLDYQKIHSIVIIMGTTGYFASLCYASNIHMIIMCKKMVSGCKSCMDKNSIASTIFM